MNRGWRDSTSAETDQARRFHGPLPCCGTTGRSLAVSEPQLTQHLWLQEENPLPGGPPSPSQVRPRIRALPCREGQPRREKRDTQQGAHRMEAQEPLAGRRPGRRVPPLIGCGSSRAAGPLETAVGLGSPRVPSTPGPEARDTGLTLRTRGAWLLP